MNSTLTVPRARNRRLRLAQAAPVRALVLTRDDLNRLQQQNEVLLRRVELFERSLVRDDVSRRAELARVLLAELEEHVHAHDGCLFPFLIRRVETEFERMTQAVGARAAASSPFALAHAELLGELSRLCWEHELVADLGEQIGRLLENPAGKGTDESLRFAGRILTRMVRGHLIVEAHRVLPCAERMLYWKGAVPEAKALRG